MGLEGRGGQREGPGTERMGLAVTEGDDAPTPPSEVGALVTKKLGSTLTLRTLMAPIKAQGEADENAERGNWSNDLQFVLACMGYAIGLGNVWRFPFQLYRHGGGFLAAYWVLLLLVAYPAFALELFLGQLASRGPVHIWRRLMPCLEGLGWSTLFVQVVNSIYYNSLHAYALFYTFSSVGAPWARCEDPALSHNSPFCFAVQDYAACVGGLPQHNLYAKAGCYRGPGEVQGFLLRLEDGCLPRLARYGSGAGKRDLECYVKLRFHLNASSLHQLFHLPDHFPYQSFLQSCGANLLSRWDSCSFQELPVQLSNETAFKRLRQQGLVLNLDPATAGSAGAKAHCLARLLNKSKLGRLSLARRGKEVEGAWRLGKGRQRELLSQDGPQGGGGRVREGVREGGRERVAEEEVGVLSQVLGAYCEQTWPGEREALVSELGLPTALCVRRVVDPVESFSSSEFLQAFGQRGQGLEDVGTAGISYQVLLCLLLAWIATVLGLYKGPKWTGKIVYVTAGFPIVMIAILIIISVFLDGSADGVSFYILFDACRLWKKELWVDALGQVFFSLGVGQGGLMTLSSYNRFHNDIVRDSLIISLANCVFSFLGGFGIFGIVGYMAGLVNGSVPEVLRGAGPGLAFVVIAQATTGLHGGEVFAFFFYFMLVLLAIDSQFAGVEMVLTFIYDEFPRTKHFRFLVTSSVAILFCCLGLPFVSNVGLRATGILDSGLYNVIVPGSAFLMLAGTTALYGPLRLLADLRLMVGDKHPGHSNRLGAFFTNSPARFYLLLTWTTFAPAGTLLIFVFKWLDWKAKSGANLVEDLGPFLFGVGPLVVFLLGAPLVALARRRLGLRDLFRPRPAWGPALPHHRTHHYAPTTPPTP